MTHNTPLPRSPGSPASSATSPTSTAGAATAPSSAPQGVAAAEADEQCRPGGPWQQILPGRVPAPPGPAHQRGAAARGAAAYAAPATSARPAVPAQPGAGEPAPAGVPEADDHRPRGPDPARLTVRPAAAVPGPHRRPGPAACAGCARRAARTSCARPRCRPAEQVTGVPVAPVPRALADAVAAAHGRERGAAAAVEAVRGGHCEPAAVVRELTRGQAAEPAARGGRRGRAARRGPRASPRSACTGWCASTVCPTRSGTWTCGCPAARTSAGWTPTGREHAVAVELDTRAPRQDEDALWSEYARKREHLERLGITVVHLTPEEAAGRAGAAGGGGPHGADGRRRDRAPGRVRRGAAPVSPPAVTRGGRRERPRRRK